MPSGNLSAAILASVPDSRRARLWVGTAMVKLVLKGQLFSLTNEAPATVLEQRSAAAALPVW